LKIITEFQQFTFYAYFEEELIALGNLSSITVIYSQDNLEESFEVKCKIFEMDKYVNGDRSQRLPMIKRKYKSDGNEVSYNNLDLFYRVRRKETEDFPDIQRLKAKLGQTVLVSLINCVWEDSVIYFEN
jgi:hypothetical protein